MPGQDNCFTEQRTALGSADVESVTEAGEIRKRHVVLPACQAIGEPCAVYIKRNIVLVTSLADLRQLIQRVKRAVFRGLGNIDQAGHDHMLVIGVVPVALNAALDGIGVKLSVLMRQGDYFVAAGFDRACFMSADMAGLRGDHALVRAKDGPYHSGVGLCSADKKIDVGIWSIAGFPDLRTG